MDADMIKERVRAYAEKAFFLSVAARKRLYAAWQAVSRREYTVRDGIILFVLAVILGATLKTAVAGTLTIGHDDYRLRSPESIIDIGALQKEMIRKGGSMSVDEAPSRASCSQ